MKIMNKHFHKKTCAICGTIFTPNQSVAKYCSEKCKDIANKRYKNKPNKTCPICGMGFYSYNNTTCCSNECSMRYRHKLGLFSYWKCIEEERNIPSLHEWIDHEHNNKMRTIVDIAKDLKASRITIMRWCKMWGIKTRTISEDNHRRYANMSQEDKNEQTQATHKGIRILFQDEEWKNNQVKKVFEAQNFNSSKPEIAMRESLIEHGYGDFISQYQLGPFFIDIAFTDIKLAVEIDGEYWHSLDEVVKRDKRKTWYIINKENWQLLRIPATPCIKKTEQVVWGIIQYIETLKQEAKYEEAV